MPSSSGPAIPYIRTILFVLGWICVIGLFVELMK